YRLREPRKPLQSNFHLASKGVFSMEPRETFRDVENLRFRFQMNNRLRLECLAAVSKVFRDFEEPIADDLLAGLIFALPQELVSANGNGHAHAGIYAETPLPPESPEKGLPPE